MIGRLVRAIRTRDDLGVAGGEARETGPTDGREERDGPDGRGDRAEQVADDGAALVEEPFLEPDERILVLLSECDGRMWQQAVVERTDYSAAGVSELLGEMAAAGRINRYWKDGEKVVSFTELGPE